MASHWRKLPLQVRLQQIFELKKQLNGDFGDAITPIDMMNHCIGDVEFVDVAMCSSITLPLPYQTIALFIKSML